MSLSKNHQFEIKKPPDIYFAAVNNQKTTEDEKGVYCPLCIEELDKTDQSFFPCSCGYQLCLWCFYHIHDELDNKCPACRREYDQNNFRCDETAQIELITHFIKRNKEHNRNVFSSYSPSLPSLSSSSSPFLTSSFLSSLSSTVSDNDSADLKKKKKPFNQNCKYKIRENNDRNKLSHNYHCTGNSSFVCPSSVSTKKNLGRRRIVPNYYDRPENGSTSLTHHYSSNLSATYSSKSLSTKSQAFKFKLTSKVPLGTSEAPQEVVNACEIEVDNISNNNNSIQKDGGLPLTNCTTPNLEAISSLENSRIFQRNLVYVVGFPSPMTRRQRFEFFSRFGRILSVIPSKRQSKFNNNSSDLPSEGSQIYSMHVTYASEEEAKNAIRNLNKAHFGKNFLMATVGSTKYCHNFLKNTSCTNSDCFYLHHIVDNGKENQNFYIVPRVTRVSNKSCEIRTNFDKKNHSLSGVQGSNSYKTEGDGHANKLDLTSETSCIISNGSNELTEVVVDGTQEEFISESTVCANHGDVHCYDPVSPDVSVNINVYDQISNSTTDSICHSVSSISLVENMINENQNKCEIEDVKLRSQDNRSSKI